MPGTNGNSTYPQLGLIDQDYNSAPSTGGAAPASPKESLNWLSVLPVVAQLGSAIFNYFSQRNENARNRAYSSHQATIAYQRQLELLAKQYELDSPTAQINRLAAAGLNPNLAYSNLEGVGSPPTAPIGNSVTGVAPTFDDPNYKDALLAAQLENIRADTGVKDKEVEWKDADIKRLFKGLDVSDQQIQEMKANVEFLKDNAGAMRALSEKYRKESSVLDLDARIKKLDADFKEQNFETNCKILASELHISEEKARLIVKTLMADIYKDNSLSNYYANKASLTPDERKLIRDHSFNYRSSGAYYQNMASFYGNKSKNVTEKDRSEIELNNAKRYQAFANTTQGIISGLISFFVGEPITETSTFPNSKGGSTTTTRKTKRYKMFRKLILRR